MMKTELTRRTSPSTYVAVALGAGVAGGLVAAAFSLPGWSVGLIGLTLGFVLGACLS
jgi:uncharacterized membrane protein YjjP (DUF1212 family)